MYCQVDLVQLCLHLISSALQAAGFNSFALLDEGFDGAKCPFIGRQDGIHCFVDKIFCPQQAFYFIQSCYPII